MELLLSLSLTPSPVVAWPFRQRASLAHILGLAAGRDALAEHLGAVGGAQSATLLALWSRCYAFRALASSPAGGRGAHTLRQGLLV